MDLNPISLYLSLRSAGSYLGNFILEIWNGWNIGRYKEGLSMGEKRRAGITVESEGIDHRRGGNKREREGINGKDFIARGKRGKKVGLKKR